MAESTPLMLCILLFITQSYCEQCVINSTNVRSSSNSDQSSSTTSKLLLSLTDSFRSSFFTSTDYTRLRNDINSLYTGEDQFTEFTFLGTAVYYCTDTQFLAAFVLLISVLLPVVLCVLWCLWGKCSVSDDDIHDYEDLPNKHLSVAAQVISWCLACTIIVLLMIMVALAAILIIGNTIIGQAVSDSDTAIRNTLPTINSLHTGFIEAVNTSLIMDYQSVNDSIYANELKFINNMLADKINNSLPYSRVKVITDLVINELVTNLKVTHNHLIGLTSFHELHFTTLNTSYNLANHINSKLAAIIQICNNTIDYEPCANMQSGAYNVSINTTYLISDNSSEILADINHKIEMVYSTLTIQNIKERITEYNELLREIEMNVSDNVITKTRLYLTPIDDNVTSVVSEIYNRFSDIDYGLPHSQELVEDALSHRYLSNWDEFRSLSTIAFSLSFIVFFVGVILAIARGLINTCGIYLYGEDSSYTTGSHLSAMMLKNFVTWIAIVGVVSAFFFVFILCLASLIGRGCGNHGNYSDLIDDVIDNNQTWGGVYPLGLTYFNDPAHPLTLSSVINSCSKGLTVAKSLQLSQLINFESIIPSTSEQNNYFDDMKRISSTLTFNGYESVLGTDILHSLQYYSDVTHTAYPWDQYNELLGNGHQLLTTSLDTLHQQLLDIVLHPDFNDSIPDQEQEYLYSFVDNTTALIRSLNDTVIRYEAELKQTCSNVSDILMVWERVPNTSANVIMKDSLLRADLIHTVDDVVEKCTIAIATNTSDTILSSLTAYIDDLYCNVSVCSPLIMIFDNFTDATCSHLMSGLDIYWSMLLLVFISSNITVVLIITLACHLADKEMLRKANNPKIPQPYHHSDHIISQLISITWLILSFGVNTWFTVAVATDNHFTCDSQSLTTLCCTVCYWVFGGIFLLICLVLCSILKVYQLIVLRRIRAYRGGGKAQQVQRYWLVRLRATVFHEGLMLFFMMYIPFTAIAGSYITTKGLPTPPSFSTLVLSLSGIIMFIVLMVKERGQMIEYIYLIQQVTSLSLCCQDRSKDNSAQTYPPVTNNSPTNGDVIAGNGGVVNRSDDIQLTAIPEDDQIHYDYAHQYDPAAVETVQVPVIMEHDDEGAGLEAETEFINDDDSIIMGDPSQIPDLNENGIEESNDQDEPIPTMPPSSILLDGLHNGGAGGGTRQSPDVSTRHRVGGVRIAHSYLSQQTDGSTPRSSLYMSEDSVTTGELPPYYQSSSHVPGYTSTDDSSYRDDYDSYESDYNSNYYNGGGQFDSKQVEV